MTRVRDLPVRLAEVVWRGFLVGLSAGVGIAVLVVSLVSILLLPVWVGVLRAPLGLQLARDLAEAERGWASRWFGVRIPPGGYRRLPGSPERNDLGGNLPAALAVMADPAYWRDLLWVTLNIPLGLALGGVSAAFVVDGMLAATVAPVVHAFSPDPFWLWSIPAGLGMLAFAPLVSPRLLRAHAGISRALLSPGRSALAARVEELTTSRDQVTDDAAAELRRIERDLHDGPQARLAALGITLGLAERIVRDDPEAATAMLAEARKSSLLALEELRQLVRGILPPVLAERGLGPAVEALTLTLPVPVTVDAALPQRFPAPTESAMYFAVAEALANVVKHSGAAHVGVRVWYEGSRLSALVRDDGVGGADPARGSGLEGIRRRLTGFDGTLTISSPPGGPTELKLEIPCELSSAKTTPFSGTA